LEANPKGKMDRVRNLMDWRVHRVGADGAFKKVVDTGSGGAIVMQLGD